MPRWWMLAVAVLLMSAYPARAAENVVVPKLRWPHQQLFGTIDQVAAQRGLQVYKEVCSSCHGLQFVAFRHLSGIGFDANQIKAIAAEFEVVDGPDADGEMFSRPGLPADYFPDPYPSDLAAAESNAGAIPPDLSLITRARSGGADYIVALLTGYSDPPEDVQLQGGQYYNKYYPGHIIAMPPFLVDQGVSYVDDTQASVEQQARDVATFLAFVADPHHDRRIELGVRVVLFLLVFAGLMYFTNRRLWSRIKSASVD